MGIAVQELLASDFFRDFEVVAGKKGVYKEIQGVATLDAPDGFKWTKGKEMILSSGYVIMHEPGCIERAFAEGQIQKSSALMIKTGRYIDRIPESVLSLCNEHELPLIIAPFGATWMEIVSQTNVAVMNRTIRKFQVPDAAGAQIGNQSYKEQKIRKILQAVESEMKFPAMLYDLGESRSYYSSSNFRRMTEYYGLSEKDYWEPSRPHTRHTLCDYISMSRYRLINNEDNDGPRVSWIIIPIRIHGLTQAFFTVMEAHSFLDYYDEFAIRIAYLMLQSLYEQISGARDAGYMGFENFIHFAMSCDPGETDRIISQAGTQGISMNDVYDYTVIRLSGCSAAEKRRDIRKAFSSSQCSRMGKLAILGDKELLLLTERDPAGKISNASGASGERHTYDSARLAGYDSGNAGGARLAGPIYSDGGMFASVTSALTEELVCRIIELIPCASAKCGICREGATLRDIRRCVEKCRKVITMGSVVRPDIHIYDYEMLGPLAWLDIPENELGSLLEKLRPVMKDEKQRELLQTLRIYLENNMNYSLTADILFAHINTVRKRIDRISEMAENGALGGISWDDPLQRMKTILLLRFLEAGV